MSRRSLLAPRVRRRILRIGVAVLGMAGAVLVLDSLREANTEETRSLGSAGIGAAIPAEADVFRLTPGDLAVAPDAEPRAGARRRTLGDFRALRAYPGAPPRIPHSLTAEEFRTMTCNSCHETGGYSLRFSAYTPVTPHPEYRNCLQCHAADAGAVEVATAAGGVRFREPAPATAALATLDWRTTDWPRIGQRAMPGSPPAIPHDLQLRGNCVACHTGPNAVAEIRTTHPERANCRQCHVPATFDAEDGYFTRPVREATAVLRGER